MTGEKDRYKTHEQLWKLEDGELSTPQHDELVLQLMNKSNAFRLISLMGYESIKWEYSVYREHKSYIHKIDEERGYYPHNYGEDFKLKRDYDEFLSNAHKGLHPIAKKIYDEFIELKRDILLDVKCEVPLVSGQNKFIIGYLDVQLKLYGFSFNKNIDTYQRFDFEYPFKRYVNSDPEITTISVYPRGSVQISNNSFPHKTDECYVNIEVKPKIKSFGETLRQINTYREVFPNGIYLIYSPDTRFKAAFESQGIKFITPSDLGLK